LSQPLLKLGGLSRVTGVPMPMLGRWLDRNTIEASHMDVTTSGSGDYRKFSRATVNTVAIASKLIALGIPAGQANDAAAHFTNFGAEDRAPNELYEFDRTILIHTEGGTRIKNVAPDASISDMLGRPFIAAVIVDVGQIIKQVDEAIISETKRKN
jgi:hypothetical protein